MAKTINLQNAPKRMIDTWMWVEALDAWDYCDPNPLDLLIRQREIPPEYQAAIADIVSGKRKQNKKAAAKLKLPAKDRLKFAAHISDILGQLDFYQYDAINPEGVGATGIAAIHRKEPIDITRELEAEKKRLMTEASRDLNISLETCENLLRDLREKIKKFPFV